MENKSITSEQHQREAREALIVRVLSVQPDEFDALALDIYRFQYRYNPLYRQFCELIGRTPDETLASSLIPHLPIALFKSNTIQTGTFEAEAIFESSTTTGQVPSRHHVRSLDFYNEVSETGFSHVFGHDAGEYEWYGLLPSYLERPNSSLVHMVRHFVSLGGGGFYLEDHTSLIQQIKVSMGSRNIILIGVTFALLDLADSYHGDLTSIHIIETGGMKGRREELTRSEIHALLGNSFGKEQIGSEYGMTELLSQAWSKGNGVFECSPTMKVAVRDISDPLTTVNYGTRGALNITDLANIDSCSFIATDDAGMIYPDGRFEVLGRLDGSEQRGCNLMYPI